MSKTIIKNTSVRNTVFHEVGHFLTYYLLRGLDSFDLIQIEESNGISFVSEDQTNGTVTGLIEYEEGNLTTFEEGIVLSSGHVSEKLVRNKKNVILSGIDKESFNSLQLTKADKTKCKKEAERILTENKDLLYFISKRILRSYRSRQSVKESGIDIFPKLTITREQIETIIQEYNKRK